MTVLVASFIKPRFIEELGEEGLTAHEVAASLGVEPEIVRRKLKRGWFETGNQLESFNMTNGMKNNINGLEYEEFFFNTNAAKAFVAQYHNIIGLRYLDFLFSCEQLALEEVPRLRLKLQEITAQKGLLQLDIKKPHKNANTVPYYSPKSALFEAFDSVHGLHNYETRRVRRDTLREPELATQERIHCSVRLAGTAKELLKREAYEASINAWESQPAHIRGEIRKPQRKDYGIK